jgi:hypothetical protein
MDNIKDIEIIKENIAELKNDILLCRVTLGMAVFNIAFVGECLYVSYDKINITAKLLSMLAIGSCFVLTCVSAEKIKRDKFTIDELKFEIEKKEGRGY